MKAYFIFTYTVQKWCVLLLDFVPTAKNKFHYVENERIKYERFAVQNKKPKEHIKSWNEICDVVPWHSD